MSIDNDNRWAGYVITMRRGMQSWHIVASSERPDKVKQVLLLESSAGILDVWSVDELEMLLRNRQVILTCDSFPRYTMMRKEQMMALKGTIAAMAGVGV